MSAEDETSTLIQEREEGAPRELYGGRTLKRDGKEITRTVFVLTCDCCGLRIGEGDRLQVCSIVDCKAKICERCSTTFQGQTYCLKCLREKLAIDEFDFNVLTVVLASQRTDIPRIVKQLEASRDTVRNSLSKLLKAELIRQRSLSVFTQFEETPLATYNYLSIGKLFGLTQQADERREGRGNKHVNGQ